ncbi:EXS family-domain-containing protein [Mrakia frigida]|uniref:EXS domain-containing protein n=1 Tax=Mrakia frigida TaxID=29902 RepID=UPI003FCC199C
MDIDTPVSSFPEEDLTHSGHYHLTVPSFSTSFPLPYRVLFLVFFGSFLWALNLHILNSLGIDTSWILGIRRRDAYASPLVLSSDDGDNDGEEHELGLLGEGEGGSAWAKGRDVYQAVYGLVGAFGGWSLMGWLVFRWLSGGEEEEEMDKWRGLPFLTALGVVVGVGMPYGGLWKKERRGFVESIKRCLTSPVGQPILFCDVITADILTSFAKVIGDLWVSSCLVFGGHISASQLEGAGSGMGYWVVPLMTAIPYFVRLRQCIVEYITSDYQNSRPLFNALKYASAFPVIILSAVQKVVVADVAAGRGVKDLGEDTWFGEHPLFRLWLLSVFINSFFSFWWDVTNDWGLTILDPKEWESKPPSSIYNPHSSSSNAFRGPGGHRQTNHKRTQSILQRAFAKFGSPSPKPQTPNASSSPIDFAWSPHHARISSHARSDPPSPNRYTPTNGASHHTTTSVDHSIFPPTPNTHNHGNSNRSPSPTPSLSSAFPPPPSNSPYSQPPQAERGSYPFGLRPQLHFPDPSVYYLAIAIDLILRFTWSLKLSSHLHTISEIESGVFLMEALELGRRWMWVFLRVEWEGIRKTEALFSSSTNSDPLSARRRSALLLGNGAGDDEDAEEILLMGMGSGLTGRESEGERGRGDFKGGSGKR